MTVLIDHQARIQNLQKAQGRHNFFLIQHARRILEDRLSFLSPAGHVVDILTLHASENFHKALADIYASLPLGGVFLGAFFGDKTLWELKETFLKVEEKMFGRVTPRFLPLFSPHILIQDLQKQGFKDIVLDQECIVCPYKALDDLYHDLRSIGETNCLSFRKKGLTSFRFFDQCQALYSERFKSTEGMLPVTFEIIYLAAWRV